jgi:endonuclease-3
MLAQNSINLKLNPAKDGDRKRAGVIFRLLSRTYPTAHCELDFSSPFQLLVATILSAQCTDKLVNQVTPGLFQLYPDAPKLAKADPRALEGLIRRIGLFRTKAKNIRACALKLVQEHSGMVPETMEELVELPGVGRKTANVVLYNAFHKPAIAVDTHVLRVGKRLGLFTSQNPVEVEGRLASLMPSKDWGNISHWLIWHGRRVCFARSPNCSGCILNKVCPSAFKA